MVTVYVIILLAIILGFIGYTVWCAESAKWNGWISFLLGMIFYIIVLCHANYKREFDVTSTGHPVKLVAVPEYKDLYIQIIELPDRNVNVGPESGYSGKYIWGPNVTFSVKTYRPGWYGLLWFNEMTTYSKDKL